MPIGRTFFVTVSILSAVGSIIPIPKANAGNTLIVTPGFGVIGGIVNQMQQQQNMFQQQQNYMRQQAANEWSQVDPQILACIQNTYRIVPQQWG